MRLDGNQVVAFEGKLQTAEGWISGAFFVLEPDVLDRIEGDMAMFEHPTASSIAPSPERHIYHSLIAAARRDPGEEADVGARQSDPGRPCSHSGRMSAMDRKRRFAAP